MAVVSNGTTIIDAGALGTGVATGKLVLLSTQTASSSSTISFTSSINSTYDSYIFKFINIHPATNETQFAFQVDTGTNTNYNQTITSSYFRSLHSEDGGTTALQYKGEQDQAQGTSFQKICINVGNQNDESCSGTLQIFAPADTTFVKHGFLGGYVNTATALTRVQFKMISGNFDGTIKMYGVGG